MLTPNLVDYVTPYWVGAEATHADEAELHSRDALTIVTAFFDIGRASWGYKESEVSTKYRRDLETYFHCFELLSRIKNRMVIFVSPDLAHLVLDLRKKYGREDRTIIYTIDDFFGIESVSNLDHLIDEQLTDRFRDFVWRSTAPEYNKSRFVTVVSMKASFVETAIALGNIGTRQAAWIDFGYPRSPEVFDPEIEWRFDFGDKINLFLNCQLDDMPIYEVVRRGDAYFQGGHVIGPRDEWVKYNRYISESIDHLTACNLIDDEQALMYMVYRRHPDDIRLRRIGNDPDLNWLYIFRRFQTGLEPADQPLEAARSYATPDWYRDMKNYIRRRARAKVRQLAERFGRR